MKRLGALLFLAIPLTLAALPSRAQPTRLPPHQTVHSHIGLMNELQKRGPNAYAHGPYAGGEYVVVGPLGPPPYRPRYHRRARHYR
jgi:hypothetical protein